VFISDPPNLSLALENLVQKHKPEEFKRRVEREVNPVRFWVNEQVGINVTHHESLHPKLVYKMLKELDQIGLTKNPLCLRTLMPQSTMLRDHWICVFLMNPNLFVCPSNTLYVQIDYGVDVGALVFLQQALPPRPRVAQVRFEDEAPVPAIPIDDHPDIRDIIEKQIRENPVAFPSLTDLEKPLGSLLLPKPRQHPLYFFVTVLIQLNPNNHIFIFFCQKSNERRLELLDLYSSPIQAV
jgi:hypothetical protein